MEKYDSTADSKEHIAYVGHEIEKAVEDLHLRGFNHDASKLVGHELKILDEYIPKINAASPEQKAAIAKEMAEKSGHYENNDHHPEHYPFGIHGMSLNSAVEMVADWVGTNKQRAGGKGLDKWLASNFNRFGIGHQFACLIVNQIKLLYPECIDHPMDVFLFVDTPSLEAFEGKDTNVYTLLLRSYVDHIAKNREGLAPLILYTNIPKEHFQALRLPKKYVIFVPNEDIEKKLDRAMSQGLEVWTAGYYSPDFYHTYFEGNPDIKGLVNLGMEAKPVAKV